jgi:UDP-N-acetylmuramate dehydrogenase
MNCCCVFKIGHKRQGFSNLLVKVLHDFYEGKGVKLPEKRLFHELTRLCPGRVRLNEPMKNHTTWRIGGPADILFEPDGISSLTQAMTLAGKEKIPVTVIGAGSNLLVKDGGVRGLVIKIGAGFDYIEVTNNLIRAGAGVKLPYLAKAARDASLGGFEFLAGIPGTVGGALIMNAGAFGGSISDICLSALLIDKTGQISRRTAKEIGFGYRSSSLQNNCFIVLEAVFQGVCRDPEDIRIDMENLLQRRKKKQPHCYPCAGSVFKNPPGYSAGYLIDQAGGKEMREGDAVVSDVHANFIVNLGEARASDVLELIKKVIALVRRKFNMDLELEIKVLGED